MNFKEEYFVWESRLNNAANDDKITEIVINVGEKRTEGKIDGKYIITVLPNEYSKVKELVDEINAKKYVNQRIAEREKKEKSKKYDEMLEKFEPDKSSELAKNKRNLKNKPNDKLKNKRFTPKEILKKIIAIVLSGIAVIGAVKGGEYVHREIDDYKKEVATESLDVLKEELNAEKIWDDSTELSSSTSQTSVSIMARDGKRYDYIKYSEMSEPKEDEIKNMEVVKAIQTVAQAQDGNVFRAIAADNLIRKINNGEIKLNYDGNKERVKGEFEIGE